MRIDRRMYLLTWLCIIQGNRLKFTPLKPSKSVDPRFFFTSSQTNSKNDLVGFLVDVVVLVGLNALVAVISRILVVPIIGVVCVVVVIWFLIIVATSSNSMKLNKIIFSNLFHYITVRYLTFFNGIIICCKSICIH